MRSTQDQKQCNSTKLRRTAGASWWAAAEPCTTERFQGQASSRLAPEICHTDFRDKCTKTQLEVRQFQDRGFSWWLFTSPVLVAIRMLRSTGIVFLVEVLLAAESEYEALVCERVLHALNAKYVVLSTLLVSTGYSLSELHCLRPLIMLFT
ncbi:hypothetical protein BJ878DRAFT_509445 [Calycina marina]|uniref:Uncharacterized protein n=1 Tax=Calycina marina TaxID=1763456 RepID=A0A9P7Z2I6_9HELO|nr:hypothetical protein BJ878DRAFT_509445 [Calycina marina]